MDTKEVKYTKRNVLGSLNDPITQRIAKWLKETRCKQNLQQKDMAELLCVGECTYGRYERGETTMPIDVICKLHKLYRVDLNFLLCGEDPKTLQDLDLESFKKQLPEIIITCLKDSFK